MAELTAQLTILVIRLGNSFLRLSRMIVNY